jgi:urea transport system permease protein
MMIAPRFMNRQTGLFAIVFALLLVMPHIVGYYQTQVLAKFILFGIFAMSLDLIWGYAGIMSFGHGAFFGVGAYVTTLVLARIPGAPSSLALLGAVVVPVLLALIMSLFLLYGKVSGVYFAIITLVVALILEQVTVVWYSLTRGLTGFTPVPPLNFFGVSLDADTPGTLLIYYYLIAFTAGVVFVALYLISRSRYGLLLQAVKNDPKRSQYLGYNIATVRTIVFVIACAIAGLAGGLYAPLEDFISPQLLGLVYSTQCIIWVAVGGRNTIVGPFIGALGLGYLEMFFSGIIVEFWYLIVGAILLAVVLFWPDGLVGYLLSLRPRAKGRPPREPA